MRIGISCSEEAPTACKSETLWRSCKQ
jgi:hypothetical protein